MAKKVYGGEYGKNGERGGAGFPERKGGDGKGVAADVAPGQLGCKSDGGGHVEVSEAASGIYGKAAANGQGLRSGGGDPAIRDR